MIMPVAPSNGNLFNYDANGNALLAITSSTGFSTLAAAKAATTLVDGQLLLVTADGSLWRYVKTSSLTSDGDFVVAAVTAGGVLIRVTPTVDLILPITFNNTDAQVLYTVPTGFRFFLDTAWWEVTTGWTGGSSSAIGLSSSNANLSTKGNILGGASGDVAATLVSTGALAKGTTGANMNKPGTILVGGDTIRFDRITSAFTAGAGNAHVSVTVLLAPAS